MVGLEYHHASPSSYGHDYRQGNVRYLVYSDIEFSIYQLSPP